MWETRDDGSFNTAVEKLNRRETKRLMTKRQKELIATEHMFQIVFLEPKSNIPWNSHSTVTGWFDMLGADLDLGTEGRRTHRSKKSAKTITLFTSKMLHRNSFLR
ncbi:hypothetical protein RvY_01232 [Ramazzottius varieornatus]|uniref:Uncharacterized protein n=1 Tax=Ramazzottius varieornatus TaxID=947166 RepID=A0A1D1UGG8_RAMVA|nr:hypothetical protein RvY_01232 [Ramazzottius varieornatus]